MSDPLVPDPSATHAAPVDRRAALAAGAAGALGAAALLRPAAAYAAPPAKHVGLPVLNPRDDWGRALAASPQVQLLPGATYTLSSTVELPDDCLIQGNGATITVARPDMTALSVRGRRRVTIRDVVLRGQADDPAGTAPVFGHVGLRVERSFDVRVQGCSFAHWRGAGAVFTGAVADDYFTYRSQLQGCTFGRCYIGVSLADRSEYGSLADNVFTTCRLAIWNSSGNWSVTGNVAVGCYGGYYAIAATSPYGALASDNWCHGAVVGNTFNHCNGGSKQSWKTETAFPIGGAPRDPGPGVVVEGLLPPTFTGNTLWYSDVTGARLVGTRWLLSGCTMSNMTVRCDGAVPIHVAGTQANGAGNLPKTSGNVEVLF